MIRSWEDNPEGEYNEKSVVLPSGRKVTIYSDRDGEKWEAYIGDAPEDAIPLDADNIVDAQMEAIQYALGH